MALKEWELIGEGFYHLRKPFKMLLGIVDISTHMALCRLSGGRFLVLDTVDLSPSQKEEFDELTKDGHLIEAVLGIANTYSYMFSYKYERLAISFSFCEKIDIIRDCSVLQRHIHSIRCRLTRFMPTTRTPSTTAPLATCARFLISNGKEALPITKSGSYVNYIGRFHQP